MEIQWVGRIARDWFVIRIYFKLNNVNLLPRFPKQAWDPMTISLLQIDVSVGNVGDWSVGMRWCKTSERWWGPTSPLSQWDRGQNTLSEEWRTRQLLNCRMAQPLLVLTLPGFYHLDTLNYLPFWKFASFVLTHQTLPSRSLLFLSPLQRLVHYLLPAFSCYFRVSSFITSYTL